MEMYQKWGQIFKIEWQKAKVWRTQNDDMPREKLRKISLNKIEIYMLSKAVEGEAVPHVSTMLDVYNELYAAGKTAEHFKLKRSEKTSFSEGKATRW
jgi:hypothetical protein